MTFLTSPVFYSHQHSTLSHSRTLPLQHTLSHLSHHITPLHIASHTPSLQHTAKPPLVDPPPPHPSQMGDASEEAEKTRKGECRATVQAVLSAFSSSLSQAAANGAAEDTRLAGLTAIKSLAKNYPVLALQHIARFLPSLASALRDIHIRHKYVAERALRHLLLTSDEG